MDRDGGGAGAGDRSGGHGMKRLPSFQVGRAFGAKLQPGLAHNGDVAGKGNTRRPGPSV